MYATTAVWRVQFEFVIQSPTWNTVCRCECGTVDEPVIPVHRGAKIPGPKIFVLFAVFVRKSISKPVCGGIICLRRSEVPCGGRNGGVPQFEFLWTDEILAAPGRAWNRPGEFEHVVRYPYSQGTSRSSDLPCCWARRRTGDSLFAFTRKLTSCSSSPLPRMKSRAPGNERVAKRRMRAADDRQRSTRPGNFDTRAAGAAPTPTRTDRGGIAGVAGPK